MKTRLGINIDHVATVRQARGEPFPDPLILAQEAVAGGANGITAHLREDRRHIQDADIQRLKQELSVPLNMEMGAAPEIIKIATHVKPAWCCLVPEKRQELTTEGGLNVLDQKNHVKNTIHQLKEKGIQVSLFIEPDRETVQAAKDLGADAIEIHTGRYAHAWAASHDKNCCSGENLALNNAFKLELSRIAKAAEEARKQGLLVNAGHGLTFNNIKDINAVFHFDEYNVGFFIVAEALRAGMKETVKKMKERIEQTQCVES